MKQYAVLGHPIAHSLSPFIHSSFAKQFSISLCYQKIDVPVLQLQQAIQKFFLTGHGLNITLPFKQKVLQYIHHLSPRAQSAQSANTLWIDENHQIHGDNTDGEGLVKDLTFNHSFSFNKKKILILGAGGAVRGILLPLFQQKPESIIIANRNEKNTEKLIQQFSSQGPIEKWTNLIGPFDLIIQGTSAGLSQELPVCPEQAITSSTVIYDMMYGLHAQLFQQWALSKGAIKIYDGLGMLVEQAAIAFSIWHGVQPKTQPVIDMLREQIILKKK